MKKTSFLMALALALIAPAVTAEQTAITLTANSDEKVYDGTELTAVGYRMTSGALKCNCDVLEVSVKGAIVDVGSTPSEISSCKITRNGSDVTGEYAVKTVAGTLTVTAPETPVVITARTYRLADNEPLGYDVSGDALMPFDVVQASVAVVTNDEGVVYCDVDSCKIMRGETDVTANYTVVTVPSSVLATGAFERQTIAARADLPKVASSTEVALGTNGVPVLVDCSYKNASLTVGANAQLTVDGEIWNLAKLQLAAGKKAKVNNVSTQLWTVADLGTVRGMSTLTLGSYCQCALGDCAGTEKADKLTVGAKSAFEGGDLDFGGGSDTLNVGSAAAFASGDLLSLETVKFGSCSTNEVGAISGLQKLTVSAGKAATKTAEAAYTLVTAGDLAMLTNKANTITVGKYVGASFGDVAFGTANDRITLGDNAAVTFGCVDFAGGKDTLTIGKNDTFKMIATDDGCASLTKFTLGAGTTAYLSSELIAKGQSLAKSFGTGATVIGLGGAETAQAFTTPEAELLDNTEATAVTLCGDVDGWLNDADEMDTDDWFVADRDTIVKVSLVEGSATQVYVYVNGVRKTNVFGKELELFEGDTLHLHKGSGTAPAGYKIAARSAECDGL